MVDLSVVGASLVSFLQDGRLDSDDLGGCKNWTLQMA